MVRALLVGVCLSVAACTNGGAKAETSAPSGGAELIGQMASEWITAEWSTGEPLSLAKLRGRVVVVRFWTNTCPFCERSMPALQELSLAYADRPVTFVGLYHSKPRGSEQPWASVLETIEQWGVTFPVAYDREWKTVSSWWLDGREPRATSASFVIGGDGAYVHVHPGPVYFPGDSGDFAALEAAIDRALTKLASP